MTQRDPFRDLHVAINAMFEVVRAKKDRRNPSPADVRETRAFRVLFADAKGRAQQRGLFIGELQSAFRDL
jgi:hypothetical protein